MSLLDMLEESGNKAMTPIPSELLEKWDIAKVYAHVEAKLEQERYEKAMKKRAKAGVSFSQLQDLKAKIERSFIDIPIATERVEKCKELYAELHKKHENEANEKDKLMLKEKITKAKSSYASAQKSLLTKTALRDGYIKTLTECGILKGDNS